MRILDKNWPWMALALLLLAAGLAGIHFMISGISEEFGAGFVVGGIVFGVIILTAVGWRRGELGRGEP